MPGLISADHALYALSREHAWWRSSLRWQCLKYRRQRNANHSNGCESVWTITLPRTSEGFRSIESFHFDAEVESLTRGMTGSVGDDIDFLVRYVPNHHRGLGALVRLALRDKTPQPRGLQISVECYLLRALEFKPSDVEVQKLYATYLARLGRNDEALVWFEQVEKLAPDDAVVAYNMGLLLTEKGEYERARAYAKRAYAGGLDFPGLRDKLARQGEWR